ncbi:hypothetical protein [Planosporangium mesophilum]|uniref:Lipoprotein n=1 Tax=Planosporangium mesophilum TaxID=689768 RepID=A0A8J3TDH2_9ACTN|nr:hypothetical protein [Planosporangium mesophilum]NJC84179.1 hypothetical protein [Planosporangium mesophilum]GII22814.1 hypothetical protein Pme01_24110 [Planosporangium mesophilum]
MRGLIAVAALCGATLLTAGCGTAAGTPEAVPSASASARPSAVAGASPDASAQAVCDDLRSTILDTDAKAFGTELGRMIAARGQGDRAGESRAQQAAGAKLGEIAGKLRTHAAAATDPRLANALTTSAANLDRLGSDPATFAGLTSLDAVSQTTGKFATALSDVADYCSA